MNMQQGEEVLPADTLARELRGLKDLLGVAQVVVSSLDLDQVLMNILRSAMTITEMPAGSIALYEASGNQLHVHAHSGLSRDFVAHDRWTVKPGGLTARILAAAAPFVVEDTLHAGDCGKAAVIAEGIRALIAVPLKMQNEIVGVLYVDDFVPRQFSAAQMEMLSILASFAAMSIDNARLHRRTTQLACTDDLTGLYNRRHFRQSFTEELSRAIRYGTPLSVVICDIDDFKRFNDRFGHPQGDVALQELARLLRGMMRGCDCIYRYGGEEFIALLPETGCINAVHAAERVRAAIEAASPALLGATTGGTGLTMSFGVASYPEDGRTATELLKAADDLLFAAKRAGKNQVCCRACRPGCLPAPADPPAMPAERQATP